MNEIVEIIAFQNESDWLVSPLPGALPVKDLLGTRMGLRTSETISRWGEQVEHDRDGYSMSSYVKPVHAKVVVMKIVPHDGDFAGGIFLFRRRVSYPRLRLFKFNFNFLFCLQRRETIECLTFPLPGSSGVASVAMNGWFRLVIFSGKNKSMNAYIQTSK